MEVCVLDSRYIVKTALTGVLAFSMILPVQALAHDEIGDVNIEKGERANYEDVVAPVMEGSKNLKFLKEVAAPEMEIVREDGKQNSFADVYAHKGYAYVGTHVQNNGNGGVRVFDLKDPANPEEIAVFANDDIPGTWQEKVIVKSISMALHTSKTPTQK